MKLYFLRHGLAGQHGEAQFKDDSLRPLTSDGQAKMQGAASGMQVLGLSFDAILSSPYLRARQTAEIVAQTYKLKQTSVFLTDKLLPPASIDELLHVLYTRFPKSKSALLVGHEPHLSQMVSSLLNCDQPLNINFKKGGLCCLDVKKNLKSVNGILCWLLTSKQLNLLNPTF